MKSYKTMPYKINDKFGTYSGETENGLPGGKGKFKAKDYVYNGEFIDGKFQGQGSLKELTSKYDGEFLHGKFDGIGKRVVQACCVDENGEEISGQVATVPCILDGHFRGGAFYGDGIKINYDKTAIKCNFINDYATGVGQIFSKNSIYTGEILNNLAHGKGEFVYKNDIIETTSLQDEYKQIIRTDDNIYYDFLPPFLEKLDIKEYTIKNGVFENNYLKFGDLDINNGQITYSGEFYNYDFNGYGKFFSKNDAQTIKYEGYYRDSVPCGQGLREVRYFDNGKPAIRVTKGEFLLYGAYIPCIDIVYSDGVLNYYSGSMRKDKKDGKGKLCVYNVENRDYTAKELLDIDNLKKEFVYSYDGTWVDDLRSGKALETVNGKSNSVVYDRGKLLQ